MVLHKRNMNFRCYGNMRHDNGIFVAFMQKKK